MADLADRILQILKWPMALLFALLLPGSLWAFVTLIGRITASPGPVLPFIGGLAAYAVLWFLLLRRPGFGSLFSTFEHELTHAVFAWLTFHKVVGLRTSWRDGGEVRYVGRGNWLIIIAPYFFPTLTAVVLLVLLLVPATAQHYAGALLGVTVAYHVTSTWLETHRRQPDLKRVGFPFAIAFIPSANLLAYGIILAFAFGGLSSAGALLSDVWGVTSSWLGSLVGLVV